MLSQDITEDIALGKLVDTYNPDVNVTVMGMVPGALIRNGADQKKIEEAKSRGDLPPSSGTLHDKSIGNWVIKLACPRPSIFDPRDLCVSGGPYAGGGTDWDDRKIQGNTDFVQFGITSYLRNNASVILQTRLSSQVTVQDFVQTETWYTKYVQLGNQVGADATKAMCADALSALYAQGLNEFDSELVLFAMEDKMPGVNHRGITEQCRSLMTNRNVIAIMPPKVIAPTGK